ncbi:hypothetical protein KCV04_g21055, partial [Aureobasidium melanogenum]
LQKKSGEHNLRRTSLIMADMFKLSASLKGHEDDVRAVVSPSARCIFSASRDGT